MPYTPFDLSNKVAIVTGGNAVYLASDASAYHTGDTLLIDGGYTKF